MAYLQEEAIRQVLIIAQKGARIFHVDYAKLVDDTEGFCWGISAFLGVPYDPAMLRLDKADKSAIFNSLHDSFLHRGIIERQKYDRELVPPRLVRKLERFRRRREGLQSKWIRPSNAVGQPQPSGWELAYHKLVGGMLANYDSFVRAGFEFIRLVWLRVYRLLKNWLLNPPFGRADKKPRWSKILSAIG